MSNHTTTVSTPADEQRVTALAAALCIARHGYDQAVTSPNPAATLDDLCDAMAEPWNDTMPDLSKFAGEDLEFAETMRAAVADRLWAFTAVEHSRAEAGDGYNYVFDLLADDLRKGADPRTVRTTALDVPKRLRELAAQACEGATSPPSAPAALSPVSVMLGITQCCARRPGRDQLNGRRLDGRKDTDATFNDRLLCTEQHSHNGDHRDALGRTWVRVPSEVIR